MVSSLVASVDTVGVDPSVTLYVGMGVVTGTTTTPIFLGSLGLPLGIALALGFKLGIALGFKLGIALTLGFKLGIALGFKLGIALTLGTKLTLGIALVTALTLGTKLTLGIALGAPHVLGVELLLVLEEPLLPLLEVEVEVEGLLLLLEVEVEVVEEGLLVPLLPPLSLLLPLSHLS